MVIMFQVILKGHFNVLIGGIKNSVFQQFIFQVECTEISLTVPWRINSSNSVEYAGLV